MTITKKLIEDTREWLGKDGKQFFLKNFVKHGNISPVYMKYGIPHPVHFREGMRVRNFLRKQADCKSWDDWDLDGNWVEVVTRAISEKEK